MKSLEKFGLSVPKILLPADSIPISSWSVIACDQYTQDRKYWEKARQSTQEKPSSLNLILPEVFLNDPDKTQRIEKIHSTMEDYMRGGVFKQPLEGFVYLERKTAYGRMRKGLIVAVDLESYEWHVDTTALIRATEATIPERIPPRMEIRRDAALELPHIMLLVNDPERILVEAIGSMAKSKGVAPLYNGDLMLGSGRVTGWAVKNTAINAVQEALSKLAQANVCKDGSVFMFAVGDGNHSLATAKAVWDEYKNNQLNSGRSAEEIADCPLRYALVEIVNIYDKGLTFEPIHRVLFNADTNKLVEFCHEKLGGTVVDCNSPWELERSVVTSKAAFGFIHKQENGSIKYQCLNTPVQELAVSRLQPVLDDFLKASPSATIDYIHGMEEVFRLGEKRGAVTILLPPIAKDSFFSTIAQNGPLPRKSFSMGEASEKRFYLEGRSIK